MARTVPRILRLTGDELRAPDGTRFALLHVVSGERHHLGWFELSDDPWRVGLTAAEALVDAGIDPAEVVRVTAPVLDGLRTDRDADRVEVSPPAGPIANRLRYVVDRRRAIARLEDEMAGLGGA